jgi:hypothetical protein
MTANAILLAISIVCITIGLIMAHKVHMEQIDDEGKNH